MSYARTAVTRMTLDMSRLDLQRSETVTLGDTNRRWEVTLINGGAPFRLPPNWTAALTGIKPDGTGLLNGCSVVDGKIIYDFAAGAEIATCVGNYPIQFDIWDEVGELVASPKLHVNVLTDVRPHAELDSNGQYTLIGETLARVGSAEEDVKENANSIASNAEKIVTLTKLISELGAITIPAADWTDSTPYQAYIQGGVLDKGAVTLFFPADDASKIAAAEARLAIKVDSIMENNEYDYIAFLRAEDGGEVPEAPINLDYIKIRTGTEEAPKVALIGVDAVGAGGGSVDEDEVQKIVKALVPSWALASVPPADTVQSVNGKVGAVTLTYKEVGADQSGAAAAVDEKVKALNGLLTTLIGGDSGKSVRAIAALVIAEALSSAPESINSLEEIAAWIEAHPKDVAELVARIKALEDAGYIKPSDIPKTLPNPNALTILGKTYDGTTAVSVTADDFLAALPAAEGVAFGE